MHDSVIVANLLGNDTHRIVLNTASILTTEDADITVLTPRAAPRVLDDPVLGAALNTPANNSNTVIRLTSIATIAVHDTRAVPVELGSIKSDSKRTILLDSGHHLLLVTSGEGVNALHLHLGLGSIETALVVLTLIRIVLLEHEATVVLDVVHGISRPATVATVVIGITVDDLLLRERKKLVVLEEVGTLASNNSAESPAGTALLLILHVNNGTLLTPVKRLGETISLLDISATDVSRDLKRDAVTLLIRELVPAIRSSRIDLVELLSASHVLLEGGIADSLLTSTVGLAELGLVRDPERIVLVAKCKSTSSKSKNDDSLHY